MNSLISSGSRFHQVFIEKSQFEMSYQIQNSTKALWTIFCLLPIQKPILLFAKSNTKQYISMHEYIKAGMYLKKGFSILDIKALLYVMNLLQIDENCNEILFGSKIQDILLQFRMVCSIGTVYLQTEDIEEKRKYFKTIYIRCCLGNQIQMTLIGIGWKIRKINGFICFMSMCP